MLACLALPLRAKYVTSPADCSIIPLDPCQPAPIFFLNPSQWLPNSAVMLSGRVSSNDDHSTMAKLTVEAGRRVWQPLHPSVRPFLDPEYVAFHDRFVQYVEPENLKPWDPSLRTRYTWPYAGSPVLKVGDIKDIRPLPNFTLRVFTPKGDPPPSGWPVVLWMHGGAFAVGNIDSDNDLCSLICRDARCVVLNIDYRLAPEHPFPAGLDDCVETLKWCVNAPGRQYLNIDPTRVVIGGVSAGGNLAAVLSLIAVELSIPILLQLLVVPVIDNTATGKTLWSLHPWAPWLTAPRMLFYRDLYLPNPSRASDWKVSPSFAPEELLKELPKTWIAVAEQDMLSVEGEMYADLLREHDVQVQYESYVGMPHGMMALSGKQTSSGWFILANSIERCPSSGKKGHERSCIDSQGSTIMTLLNASRGSHEI